jgi:hypothetical protein
MTKPDHSGPMTEGNSLKMNCSRRFGIEGKGSKRRDGRLREPQPTVVTPMTEGNSLKMNFNSKARDRRQRLILTFFIAKKVTKRLVFIQSRSGKNQTACFASKRC